TAGKRCLQRCRRSVVFCASGRSLRTVQPCQIGWGSTSVIVSRCGETVRLSASLSEASASHLLTTSMQIPVQGDLPRLYRRFQQSKPHSHSSVRSESRSRSAVPLYVLTVLNPP